MRKVALTFGLLSMTVWSFAQNGAFYQGAIWGNHTGVDSFSSVWPNARIDMRNQNDASKDSYGDRMVWWMSNDGGATAGVYNGHQSFVYGFDLCIDTDALATRTVEAGIFMEYQNHGFYPTSQFYLTFNPGPGGTTLASLGSTSGDWAMPPVNFGNVGYQRGTAIHMEVRYDYNTVTHAGKTRIVMGSFMSPYIAGSWGGTAFDLGMKLGGYFQPLVEPGNPSHNSYAEFKNISFRAVPEPGTFVALGVGALALALRRRNR